MSDTTTPTGADSFEKVAAEMRAYGDRESLPTSVVLHWANRLAALSSVADGEAWAALRRFVKDAQQVDVGGGDAVVTTCESLEMAQAALATRPAAPVGGDGEASAGTFQQWFASEHPETNRLADAGDLAAIGNRYAAREGRNAALATRPAAAGVGEWEQAVVNACMRVESCLVKDDPAATMRNLEKWWYALGMETTANGFLVEQANAAPSPERMDYRVRAPFILGDFIPSHLHFALVERRVADLAPCLRDALSALAPSPGAGGEWIEVGERLPEVGTDCLVWTHPSYSKGAFAKVDRWDEQHESPVPFSSATIPIGPGWDDSEFDDVTHWQPLPPPPATHHQEQRNDG